MALVESVNVKLGTIMPDIQLNDPDGSVQKLSSIQGEKGTIIVFTCNHCPYAIAIWGRLIQLDQYLESQGISMVAINPNIHPDYPQDSPENMAQMIEDTGISFPYLVDHDQSVAQTYQAQCTPDLYLLNPNRELIYHGRLDDNWQDENQVQVQDLKQAADNLIAGHPINSTQYPSMGCAIKWK